MPGAALAAVLDRVAHERLRRPQLVEVRADLADGVRRRRACGRSRSGGRRLAARALLRRQVDHCRRRARVALSWLPSTISDRHGDADADVEERERDQRGAAAASASATAASRAHRSARRARRRRRAPGRATIQKARNAAVASIRRGTLPRWSGGREAPKRGGAPRRYRRRPCAKHMTAGATARKPRRAGAELRAPSGERGARERPRAPRSASTEHVDRRQTLTAPARGSARAGPRRARAARCARSAGGARRRCGGTIRLIVPCSSSSSMKTTPLAVPGRWRATTRPPTRTRVPCAIVPRSALVDRPARGSPARSSASGCAVVVSPVVA